MTSGHDFDVAIVGAGPNGLTAAAYLARAGARVGLFERRFERGGTFATDDYSTPFLYNIAQFALPLGRELPPYRDLELDRQGVRFVEPELVFSVASPPDGEAFVVGRGGQGLGDEVVNMFEAVSEAVTPLLYRTPEQEETILARLRENGQGAAAALAEHTPATLSDEVGDPRGAMVLRYACGLAGFLDPDTPLGLIGGYAVARLFIPSLVVGGTKNLANGIYRAAATAGARCAVTTEVTRIEFDGDVFVLRFFDGRAARTSTVVSTLDPKSTFGELLAEELRSSALSDAAAGWVHDETGPFTAHYGVKGPLPDGESSGRALFRLVGFRGAGEVAARFDAVRRGELPSEIAGHVTTVTAHDKQQASPGPFGPLNTFRFEAIVPFEHPQGSWDKQRRSYRKACWDALVAATGGLSDVRLLFQFSDSPVDLERRFRTARRGSVRQGLLVRGQTFIHRPHSSCSSTRTPIPGFYLGGGGVHPGIPGTLGGGYNVAVSVCEDLGLDPWWARKTDVKSHRWTIANLHS